MPVASAARAAGKLQCQRGTNIMCTLARVAGSKSGSDKCQMDGHLKQDDEKKKCWPRSRVPRKGLKRVSMPAAWRKFSKFQNLLPVLLQQIKSRI